MDTVSFSIRTWRDPHTGTLRMRVLRVDPEEEVALPATSFLLRVPTAEVPSAQGIDASNLPRRCYIKHIPTAREAFVQGGPDLYAFVEHCLLASDRSGDTSDADAEAGARAPD